MSIATVRILKRGNTVVVRHPGPQGEEGGSVLGAASYRHPDSGKFYLKHPDTGNYHELKIGVGDAGIVFPDIDQTGTATPT